MLPILDSKKVVEKTINSLKHGKEYLIIPVL